MSKSSLFLCLVLLSSLSIASGQVLRSAPLPSEALEKADDAPLLLWRTGVSPRMVSVFGPFTSYQVNVDSNGLNMTGDAANEPSICVDPTNPAKMAIGWRQFNSVASNFRQSGVGYSNNGGVNWTFPGVLENNVFRSDPVLYSDDTGRFFYLSLLQSFFDDMWRSLDGGMSWLRLGSATGGDKQWFTIDNTNSTGRGFQYQAWSTGGNNYQGRQFSRSTDGGFTWLDPINIPNSPAWGTPDVDSNGTLFIGGVNLNTRQPWCVRSSNAKNGAVTPTFDQSTAVNLGGVITISDPINPVGLVGQIFLAADRSGTSTNNNIYMLASVQPTGFTTGSDVMFVRSTNSGQTFSAPRRINDDAINHAKHHWMGTLAVAPNGRIDSVWLDTRNAANNTDSRLFYSYSLDGGDTWSRNRAVSNAFNPFVGYPNQNKMGDYLTMVSDNGGGNVAYCATFNQEEDVYFVRVTPTAPVAQSAASRKVHGGAGTFDIPLPLSGNVGIECRSESTAQIIVNFAAPVTLSSAAVTAGTGNVASFTASGSQVTVNLTGLTNAQVVTVKLGHVNDGIGLGDVSVSMALLVGDVSGNGATNASDVGQTKLVVGQAVTGSNFRADVNLSGTLSATDVSIVKASVGTAGQ
ncbi:MAG: dockerin type I domain-containing protein [Chthoniobacterales bacterium]